jgi:uncharacterized membrane protein
MTKNRIEAFSDGVLAIIITIMVLEFKIPESPEWSALSKYLPTFLSYVLSFTYIGIYWGNHHHLLHTVKHVSSGIIWANLNLLFWLSLIPFATGWMGNTHFAQNTVIAYAVLLMISGVSYFILQKIIQSCNKTNEVMARAYAAQQKKVTLSIVFYSLSIVFAFYNTTISEVLFMAVAALWIVPDKNIERAMGEKAHS